MITHNTILGLKDDLLRERGVVKNVGFVPTMGALHEGHLELMRRAKAENEILVVSIFVNPIQFNNKEDLAKYPRVLDTDSQLLESVGCDYLFAPSEMEMYPEPDNINYDFGLMGEVMEGAFRPGHFNGVAIVVRKLFEIVEPQRAYFGEKDFQQLAVIQQLVKMFNLPVEIVSCAIVRENDGLAMSSRNMRLTPEERAVAPKIHLILQKAVKLRNVLSPEELRRWTYDQLEAVEEFNIDYVEIADSELLQPIQHWNDCPESILFVALFLGKVRLIDNMRIF
ncbi:MAG: pantoate--beta-alanine ligase [Bacteroidetes bacterium HGW-Bacteroidetes-1]|jgi:pantoate--beta-alanine ligase|nr:MAG: pantoate--beta-alanine ligase [Bacteroidetes bacterium HGW-Bacteroidetes-1]